MSDFTHAATCPGCGRRFAPDDGACCLRCEQCGEYAYNGTWDTEDEFGVGGGWVCDECAVVLTEAMTDPAEENELLLSEEPPR